MAGHAWSLAWAKCAFTATYVLDHGCRCITLAATAGVLIAHGPVAAKWLLLGRVRNPVSTGSGRAGAVAGTSSTWCGVRTRDRSSRRLEGTLHAGVALLQALRRAHRPPRAAGPRLRPTGRPGHDPRWATARPWSAQLYQAHSFEDRVLKIDRVHVEAGSTVGSGAIVFYGARIGAGSHVAAQSLVMKHEQLPPARRYAGCPAEPA